MIVQMECANVVSTLRVKEILQLQIAQRISIMVNADVELLRHVREVHPLVMLEHVYRHQSLAAKEISKNSKSYSII